MMRVVLKKVYLWDFIKILSLSGVGVGLFFGCIVGILSFFDLDAQLSIGCHQFSRFVAMLMWVCIAPIFWGLIFALLAVVSYPFFNLMLKHTQGIRLELMVRPISEADEDAYEEIKV